MLWTISMIVVIALFVVAARILLTKTYGRLRYAFVCLILVGCAIILYFPYFYAQYNFINALLSAIFNTMQIISLDAEFFGVYELIPYYVPFAWLDEILVLLLALLHISLPLVTILTAYNIIAYFTSHARLRLKKFTTDDVFVFSTCSKIAEACALDISKNHDKKMYSIFSKKNNDDIDPTVFSLMDCVLYEEDITKVNVSLKANRKVFFINMSEDEDENLNNTLSLIDRYAGTKFESNINILTFLKRFDSDVLIDATEKGNINIRVVDEDQQSVYTLFNKKPLYVTTKNNTISLLITGFDNCGEEVLKAALWCGQMDGIKLKINIITNEVERKKAKLLFDYPEILVDDYNIKFHEANLDEYTLEEVLMNNCLDTTYVVVTNDSDEENIRLAIFLRRFFLRCDPNYKNRPFIAARIKSNEKYEAIKNISTPEFSESRKVGYDIYPFGNFKEVYSYDELIRSPIEQLAKNVHLTYEEIFNNSGEIDVPATLARYNIFEVKKKASRANAMHIKYKLWSIGLDYTETTGDEAEVDLFDYLDEEKLMRLAILEHDRWMAFLRTEGWARAQVDEVSLYKELSKGRHECPILKLHPYICSFDELQYNSKELGLPDATVYDIELIKRIPDILGDKWGVAGIKYKIVKSIGGLN